MTAATSSAVPMRPSGTSVRSSAREQPLVEVGVDRTWCDDVDANAIRRADDRERARQPFDAGLRRGIGRGSERALRGADDAPDEHRRASRPRRAPASTLAVPRTVRRGRRRSPRPSARGCPTAPTAECRPSTPGHRASRPHARAPRRGPMHRRRRRRRAWLPRRSPPFDQSRRRASHRQQAAQPWRARCRPPRR